MTKEQEDTVYGLFAAMETVAQRMGVHPIDFAAFIAVQAAYLAHSNGITRNVYVESLTENYTRIQEDARKEAH